MNKNKKPKMTKNDLKTAKRLMKYVTEKYKFQFILVFFCILISAVATTAVSLSLRYLLDDLSCRLLEPENPGFCRTYKALTVLGVIFLAGVIATFIYTRMMVYIGQGVLKRYVMICLNISDTANPLLRQNTNGSIMSLYTNDTDTLRQMISQAIPQALMALFYNCCNFYFHAGAESASYDTCSSDHFCDACCYRQDRSKEWKILCTSADVSGRCDRFRGRTNERTEGSKGI